MLETAVQLERDPPETVTSDSMKSVDASERVKVRVDDSPALRELSASSSVMAMVGAEPSMTRALLPARESLPSRAGSVSVALLPAASWMVPPLRASEEVAL